MYWVFTVVLIGVCAGTVAFTGLLLRRLFTFERGVDSVGAAERDR